MSFAFLFLTYDNIINTAIYFNFFENQNIYIHPKYVDTVDNRLKQYIIKNILNTEWCGISIINATLK
jgi:hypothetical protein